MARIMNRLKTGPSTDADLIVVGASFAGLTAARAAAMRGLRVIVLEAKPEPGARIHTTGILVREAIEEIDIPSQLTRRVPGVRLYAPNLRSMDLFSPGYAFFTTRTADLLRWMMREAEAAGATVLCGERFTGAIRQGDAFVVEGRNLRSRYLVGADGPTSRVARSLGLGQNRRHLVGVEIEFELDDAVDPRFLHCFVDSRIAPGYIAWVAPGPDTIQVGAATTREIRPDLDAFLEATEPMFGWRRLRKVGRRGGLIPAGGPVARAYTNGAMLIGDAAGWVSPATGGGIRLAFRWGRRAAALIADHLQSGGPEPGPIVARELPRFRLKRMVRAALDLAPPNPVLNVALSTSPMRALAEWVYFRRRGSDMDRKAFLDWLDSQPNRATAEPHGVPPRGEILS